MSKVKNKLALGISIVQEYAKAEQRLEKLCPGGHASGHYRKGKLCLGEEFKGITNSNYNVDGGIRSDVDARALDLQHATGNRGADIMSEGLYKRLLKSGIKPTELTRDDYKKHYDCHCEHIIEIENKADKIRSIPNISGSGGRNSIIRILTQNTAVATITMGERKLLDNSKKGWERYANLPVVYTSTGQVIKSQKDLLACRNNDPNNSIAKKFQSLSNVSQVEWVKYEKMAMEKVYRGKKQAKWTRIPNLADPVEIAIIKRNDPIEITKVFWPDHLKRRFLKDKTQAQAVAKKYNFIWYR